MGVRTTDVPVLELHVDYTGETFVVSDVQTGDEEQNVSKTPLPYFAPLMYQTVGLQVYFEHTPHWRIRYSLHARPFVSLQPSGNLGGTGVGLEAINLAYGAELELKLHRKHFFKMSFERTDALAGYSQFAANMEMLLMAQYTGVF